MKSLNPDDVFEPILASIKSGDIKTTHQLRLVLDSLSETFEVKALLILVAFREWLAKRNIDLSTDDGMVTISKIANKK
jgi:hypothetical protein